MFQMLVKGAVALALLSITVGCSVDSSKPHSVTAAKVHSIHKVQRVSRIPTRQGKRQVTLVDRVVWNMQKQQGKQYRWGGVSPVTGFDCSGLTQYAFRQGAGMQIPRTAAEQYGAAVKVQPQQARKGDMIFFHTRGSGVSHVGLYLGNGKFVHAPRTGKAITVSNLSGYWAGHLVGFGRIPGICRTKLS